MVLGICKLNERGALRCFISTGAGFVWYCLKIHTQYCKVSSRSTSWLVTCLGSEFVVLGICKLNEWGALRCFKSTEAGFVWYRLKIHLQYYIQTISLNMLLLSYFQVGWMTYQVFTRSENLEFLFLTKENYCILMGSKQKKTRPIKTAPQNYKKNEQRGQHKKNTLCYCIFFNSVLGH